MSKTIKEVLQLHWMDGAKLSGGSYHGEPSLNAEEAMAEITRLLEEARPSNFATFDKNSQTHIDAFNGILDLYHQNIKKILGE